MGAILLFLVAFVIVAAVPRAVRLTALLCLGVRAAIAIGSAASRTGLYGAGEDGEFFLGKAIDIANGRAGGWSWSLLGGGHDGFTQVYGAILALVGAPDDRYSIHLISLIGAAVCLLLLAKSWMLLLPDDTPGLKFVLIIYTLLPSLASNQSYVLREGWQSAAVLLVFYTALSWHRHGARPWHAMVGPLGVVLGGALHHSLPITMTLVGLLAIGLGQHLGLSLESIPPVRIVGAIVFTGALLVLLSPVLAQSSRFQELGSGELIERTAAIVERGTELKGDSRAFYGSFSDIGKPWTWPLGFAAYQLAPIPILQARSPLDIIVIGENALRLWLLRAWWRNRSAVAGENRQPLNYAIGMWFTVELAWSIGTINWGTAIRHHAMGFSLLLLAGFVSHRSATACAKPAVRVRTGNRGRSPAQASPAESP